MDIQSIARCLMAYALAALVLPVGEAQEWSPPTEKYVEENNQIPVIINTAYSAYQDSFLSWCADAYVTKSSDLTPLKDTIRTVLSAEKVIDQ